MYPSEAEKQRNLQEFLKKKENRLRYGTTSYKASNLGAKTRRLSAPSPVTNRACSKLVVNERPKSKFLATEKGAAKNEPDMVSSDNHPQPVERDFEPEMQAGEICDGLENHDYKVALETLRSALGKKARLRENDHLHAITELSERTQMQESEGNAREALAKNPGLLAKVSRYTKTVIVSAMLAMASVALATFDDDTWEWLLDSVSTVEYIDFFGM